jgi:hypothetical protein
MVENVQTMIQNALIWKRVPPFNPRSIGDIARNLGIPGPISVKNVLSSLDKLPPAGVMYQSGRFSSGTVHADGELWFQSDGLMAFTGQAHESNLIAGDNFFLAMMLLDVTDPSGKPVVFVHSDTLGGAGALAPGFPDKEWHDYGFNQIVKDNWEAVRRTRVVTTLHASTDPLQVTDDVILGAFAVIGVAIASIFISKADSTTGCPAGYHWECNPQISSPQTPGPGDPQIPHDTGVGVELNCRCVPG